jgi:ABC-type lipoprotein export system ATPase subunit
MTRVQDTPLIVCDNLVKIYKIADLEVVALQGLDLVVRQGELLGVVGASGSGKSTLMNILGGLDRPSAGRAWVNGKDLVKMSDVALDHYRRSTVGFVWQQSARNLVPYLTALENVELPMTLSGQSGRKKRQRAQELLDAVGIADRQKHRLTELSGGEQQRVAIAVAIANQPRLLLGDEPTGEVDEDTSQVIYHTFQELNRQLGVTILIVSHDPGISHHVDRVVAIRDGKTATETIRQPGKNGPALGETLDAKDDPGEAPAFDVLTVLDSAGRLQVPAEYLEQFNIQGRVRLEPVDEGILIRPAAEVEPQQRADLLVDGFEGAHPRGLRALLSRWREIGQRKGRRSS